MFSILQNVYDADTCIKHLEKGGKIHIFSGEKLNANACGTKYIKMYNFFCIHIVSFYNPNYIIFTFLISGIKCCALWISLTLILAR